MQFMFENLDDQTRRAMEQEIDRDIAEGRLYISPRLNLQGQASWAGLLRDAVRRQNEVWLAEQVRNGRLLKTHEERRKPKGGTTLAVVPVTAPETLAEGEFNRYYARGLCVRAMPMGRGRWKCTVESTCRRRGLSQRLCSANESPPTPFSMTFVYPRV